MTQSMLRAGAAAAPAAALPHPAPDAHRRAAQGGCRRARRRAGRHGRGHAGDAAADARRGARARPRAPPPSRLDHLACAPNPRSNPGALLQGKSFLALAFACTLGHDRRPR
eukprot:167449-Rhodomonas_salina.1